MIGSEQNPKNASKSKRGQEKDRNQPSLAVFISGGGTNLQALIDACHNGEIPAKIDLVISSKKDAYGLIRAAQAGIDHFYSKDQAEILVQLQDHHIDYIILAGYLTLVSETIIQTYENRIINIHPSLIPAFSGKGYYGMKVHEAAIKRGVKLSGVTVHLVNQAYDEGKILAQEAVPVYEEDRPEDLANRVLKVEHRILVETVRELLMKEN